MSNQRQKNVGSTTSAASQVRVWDPAKARYVKADASNLLPEKNGVTPPRKPRLSSVDISVSNQPAGKSKMLSWTKKPFIFGKAKQSAEWHQAIEAVSGVLHPSDPKFPYPVLWAHTDAYIKKKSKIGRSDADARLAALVNVHNAKDVAIAAVSYNMTATGLRALLRADLNVVQGSYSGLDIWLQCLIGANVGNPASVTELEAQWARLLLPYVTTGVSAAKLYLEGVSMALQNTSTPSMSVLPEFQVLLRRAITDYSSQLEGLRLTQQWLSAHQATAWMKNVQRTSPCITPPGNLLPDHVFDSQFPVWRLWTQWQPNIARITQLATLDRTKIAIIPDIVALEGPDVLTGQEKALREGLISQHGTDKPWIRFQALIIEVPNCTKEGLSNILNRVAKNLDVLSGGNLADPGWENMLRLFKDLMVSRPLTSQGLDLLEATMLLPHISQVDVYATVRDAYLAKGNITGQHISLLKNLLRILDEPQAYELSRSLLQPWLIQGFQKCLQDCKAAIQTHIDMSLPWTHLARELHQFCRAILDSKHSNLLVEEQLQQELCNIISHKEMELLLDMYTTVQAYGAEPSLSDAKHVPMDSGVKRKVLSSEQPVSQKTSHHLEGVIETYIAQRFLKPMAVNEAVEAKTKVMLSLWTVVSGARADQNRRALIVLVSREMKDNNELYCERLKEISSDRYCQSLPLMHRLLTVMIQADTNLPQAVVGLAKLCTEGDTRARCWESLLYSWLECTNEPADGFESFLIKHTLQTMKAGEWLDFMQRLCTIFEVLTLTDSQVRPLPHILHPRFLDWVPRISQHIDILAKLEASLEDTTVVQFILLGREGLWTKNLVSLLECLKEADGKPVESIMLKLVSKLSVEKTNDWAIKECFLGLLLTSPDTIEICEKIWDAKHGTLHIPSLSAPTQLLISPNSVNRSLRNRVSRNSSTSSDVPPIASVSTVQVPHAVAEVMVAGWIQGEDCKPDDKMTIRSFAKILELAVYDFAIPTAKLTTAGQFWDTVEKEIVAEANRLRELQKALKKRDPKGTVLLLQELGIPDISILDEEIDSLPRDLRDSVQSMGDNEVDISFSLSSFTQHQRNAMGVPTSSTSIHVRLFVDCLGETPPSFCTHYNNDPNFESIEHTPWICAQDSTVPHRSFCKTKETAFLWQLNRMLHTHLKNGTLRITELHAATTRSMAEMGTGCISCGKSHYAPLARSRRSVPCDLMACAQLWYMLPLDVRIPEIKTDIFAVDMMLTSVYVAASTNKTELLASCPIRAYDKIKAILNTLPTLSVLRDAVNLSSVLRTYHKDAERLISWACVHFRGYLATATGLLRIPNLAPKSHQFVLVNANPNLEQAFLAKLARHKPKTTVLFHGTSMDRLPSILSQGLKICSGTTLQRTGAAHGKGIYMAEEPGMSFRYAPQSLSWRNSGLTNLRLLLGCEVVGEGRKVSAGVHVLTDEKSVMVRYVFLFAHGGGVPVANTIVPAMASGMSALRTGRV